MNTTITADNNYIRLQAFYDSAMGIIDDGMEGNWPTYVADYLRKMGATDSEIEEVIQAMSDKFAKVRG